MGDKRSNVHNAGLSWTNLWNYYSLNAGQEPLTPEQKDKLVEFSVSKNIPPENIREVLATGKVNACCKLL